MAEDNMTLGYLMGQEGNNNNGGGFLGGEGIWAIILFAMIFGYGGNGGFGGFGGGFNGALTRAELYDGFAIQNIDSAVRGVQQGICDSTYALTNSITSGFNNTNMGMMQGFNGVERGFCDLSHQLSDCCCENRQAIAQVRYDMATQACDTRNLIQSTTRDLIENQNANFRALMDYQVNREMRDKDAKIAELQAAALTAQQNAYITANQEAQTAELIRRLGRDCPVPAYVVPNPNCCYGNPVGVNYGGNGCGCNQYS